MDWGLLLGALGIGYAVFVEWNARKERERLYSFLNGLRAAIFADPPPRGAMLQSVEIEMARLEPRAFEKLEAKKARTAADAAEFLRRQS